MKAIIMAGGEGARLRPLTCDCPKPMLRLMDKPIMEYALLLLSRYGIRKAAATLGYQPCAVTDYFGSGMHGVELSWFIEDTPLGTAGGVKRAEADLSETFIVLSGDGVTDLEIDRALAFHREKSAMATIVLKRVDRPLEYGVVVTDGDGRVLKFLEKPGWSEVVSDTVNTGIYILEPEVLRRIPEGFSDFGRDIFPKMVAEGLPVYGYEMDGYWCDIGSADAYLSCHRDALDGRINLGDLPGLAGKVTLSPGVQADASARLESPCYIAPGVRLGADVTVGEYTVIGQNALLLPGSSVRRAVLWQETTLMEGAQARGAILAAGATLRRGAQAYESAILGTNADVGERSRLLPGVRIWPGKRTGDDCRVESNLIYGAPEENGFIDGAIPLLSPSHATRVGEAVAAEMRAREVLLGRGSSHAAEAMWHAVASGLMAQGVTVLNAGVATPPVLRFGAESYRAELSLHVDDERATPYLPSGAPLPVPAQRSIAAMVSRQDFARPVPPRAGTMRDAPGLPLLFAAALSDDRADYGGEIALYAENAALRDLAEAVLTRGGCAVRHGEADADLEIGAGEVGLYFSPSGESVTFSDGDGALSESEMQLLAAWTAMELGETDLLLPGGVTQSALRLAQERGVAAHSSPGDGDAWRWELTRSRPVQGRIWFDGLFFAVRALSAMAQKGLTLSEWRREMPRVYRRSRSIRLTPAERGRVLQAFTASPVRENDGWACVLPDSRGSACRVVTESMSAEHSRELFDFVTGEIARILREK